MTRREILAEVDLAEGMLATERARLPSDPSLAELEQMLRQLRGMIDRQWPVPRADLEGLDIGYYAVRNLNDDFPDLARQVSKINSRARRATEGDAGSPVQPPQG